jgi:anti-sigma B factor antagonist/stage II sporulation protein AA (anti-sigma F factor antagonist)
VIGARVEVDAAQEVHVARFSGDLDLVSVPAVQRDALVATTGASRVALDLTDVAWLDSTGLRMLDDLARAYEARGAAVRIVAPADVPARFTLDLSAWRPELIVGRLTDALEQLSQAP